MKKRLNFIFIFILVLGITGVFGQETYRSQSGLKPDLRLLERTDEEHNFDVIHYEFDWKIDSDAHSIEGLAKVMGESTIQGLDSITLNLMNTMTVDGVEQNQNSLIYSHQNDLLTIYFGKNYKKGESFTVEISYSGHPTSGLYYDYHGSMPIIYSLTEPSDARHWFPCYDFPSDKATADLNITVPSGLTAASNGTLVEVKMNADDTVTYSWEISYPIATYLISVAATNYVTFSHTYNSGQEEMDVVYYVYPELFEYAKTDFANTVPQIEFYSEAFGEYPFLREKYGMALIPGGTAMEHQTCTSYPARVIDGEQGYDWLIAHELAHQWWGDLVTPADWAEIWLNEGFATYSDALWWEHLYGMAGLKARMSDFRSILFERYSGPHHAIYDPPQGYLFSAIEYEKGAWVLHMLRFVVGEDNFWEILKTYAQRFAYAIASTDDFKSVCEEVYEADLDWFFDQWIYEPGYPRYEFSWGHSGPNSVRIIINQTQESYPIYSMPIELQVVLPSGTVKRTVWVDEKLNVYDLSFAETPSDVLFDPDEWILCYRGSFQKKGLKKR
ncbi:MAG: M1 family metallopeptidase [Candidatus Aminicenantes bacterium]|jgi:aminopeptidase N